MKVLLPRFGLGLALLCVVGTACDRDPGSAQPAAPTAAGSSSGSAPAAPSAAGGESTDLGVRNFGDYFILATRRGPARPGGETTFDLKTQNGNATELRCWIGLELGRGATKVPAVAKTPDTWQVTLKIPDPLPPDSELWVQRGSAEDPKGSVSVPLKTQ